jgi:hypothetical protein
MSLLQLPKLYKPPAAKYLLSSTAVIGPKAIQVTSGQRKNLTKVSNPFAVESGTETGLFRYDVEWMVCYDRVITDLTVGMPVFAKLSTPSSTVRLTKF